MIVNRVCAISCRKVYLHISFPTRPRALRVWVCACLRGFTSVLSAPLRLVDIITTRPSSFSYTIWFHLDCFRKHEERRTLYKNITGILHFSCSVILFLSLFLSRNYLLAECYILK
uniref:Uncharacterized protein n=1 Tax=Anopheles dirus TaxID=7168 RepID=A0A182NYJ6_9DIPT